MEHGTPPTGRFEYGLTWSPAYEGSVVTKWIPCSTKPPGAQPLLRYSDLEPYPRKRRRDEMNPLLGDPSGGHSPCSGNNPAHGLVWIRTESDERQAPGVLLKEFDPKHYLPSTPLLYIHRPRSHTILVCTGWDRNKNFKKPLFDKKWKICMGHWDGYGNHLLYSRSQ